RTLLAPQPASRLAIDLLAQAGAAPASAIVDHVRSVLGQVTSKPVSVLGPASVAGGARHWTPAELATTADAYAGATQGNGRAVLHLLFVHGTLGDDDSVLGVAVRGDLAAIFVDRVEAAGTVLVSPDSVEDSVTMHETGHLLGLVNLVLHTGRQDPQHPGHSRNPRSVMYWAVESDIVTQVIDGPPPRDFDADDLRDLATIGSM